MTEPKGEAAVGLATPTAIRTRRAVAGRTDIDLSVATRRMVAGVMAPARMRVNPAAAPATTMTGAAKADAAVARMTMTIDGRRHPDGAMAAGRAIRKVMQRLRAAGGKTAGRTKPLRI